MLCSETQIGEYEGKTYLQFIVPRRTPLTENKRR